MSARTTVAPASGPRLFNPTIAGITLRGLLGRRRSLLLIPLPLVLIALSLLVRTGDVTTRDALQVVVTGLGVAVILPLTALIIGTSVLGSEIDDGTIVHILAKPVTRREIVLTKYLVAAVVSGLVAGVSLLIAGTIVASVSVGIGFGIAGLIGAFVYSALFVLTSLVIRRAVLVGLAYILLWEGLLGNVLDGTKVLSVQKYVSEFAATFSGSSLVHGPMSLILAIVMSAVLTVGALALAVDRLRSFSMAGETS
ncbi:ABC transporter permease [Actinocatenispora sera]|uniref:ABC transporter permease n=1 Tax=Actinocatenispora sera TaxID=390989 RepID=UPI00340F9CFE